MQRILEATFKLSNDNKYTMRIENIKEDAADAEIKAMMDLVVARDIIMGKGAKIVSKDSAKLISVTESAVSLV